MTLPPEPADPAPPATPARGGAQRSLLRQFQPQSWYAAPKAVFMPGNQVALLHGGDQLFPAMVAAIARARHEVWLASYIFHTDESAQAVAQALAAAARRGVRVRVVVDGFGCLASLPTLQRWLLPSGVALVVYRPLTRWWNWLQPGQLRRLHQKLCVVDGEQAFVGGINLIDDRNDLNHGRGEQPRLDFAVAVRGPVVAPVEQTIRAVWSRAMFGRDWRHELLSLARSAEPLQNARKLWRDLHQPKLVARGAEAPQPVLAALVVRDNLRQRRTIERACIEALSQARHEVDLVTPYFYPGRAFRRVLVRAARRGVRVRLLLQGKLDYRLAGLAARVLYDGLLAEGIEIHEYTAAFLHAKAARVDGEWATVGSSNVDPLSLLLNLEANLLVRDAGFNQALGQAFEQALLGAQRVTVAPLPQGWRGWLVRGLVAGLARWYLRMAGSNGRY